MAVYDLSDFITAYGIYIVKAKSHATGYDDSDFATLEYDTGSAPIYGVSGLYQYAPSLTRTDDAEGMSFAINSSSGSIVSDFDDVFPFNQMETFEDTAGTMVYIPEMYFRVGTDNNNKITDIAVSSMPGTTGNWYHVGAFAVGAYKGVNQNNKIVSKSGRTLGSINANNYLTYSRNNGESYCAYDIVARTVLMFLFWIEFATKKSDSIMSGRISGSGTAGGSSKRPTGGTDEVSTPSGYETTYGQMRYRYIEDFIGNTFDYVAGIRLQPTGTASYAQSDPANYSYSIGGEQLSYVTPSNGYIKAFGWDENHPFCVLPIETGGDIVAGSNSYFCDDHYAGSSSSPVLCCGSSYYYSGPTYGLSCCGKRNDTGTLDDCGSRLRKIL